VKRYRFALEIVHPEVERIDPGEQADEAREAAAAEEETLEGLRRIVPEYIAPDGVNPRMLRRLIGSAMSEYADLVPGHLPEQLVRERGLPDVGDALRQVHDPAPEADIESVRAGTTVAHERLVLEELYLLELGLALRRGRRRAWNGIPLQVDSARVEAAPRGLPFSLTQAQRRAWGEIRRDLGVGSPMNRLLQGDVGSGKTAVAYLAAVAAAATGKQSALMAPTELLAEQHDRTLRSLASQADDAARLRVGLLTSSVPRAEAGDIKKALAGGELDLIVGTHALLQPDVAIPRMALAIVDEQHRFGVRQRQALAAAGEDGRVPHTLVMTATPIPRTLALTLYGDLDLSVIDELPPGRTPVRTLLFRSQEGSQVAELVRETTARGEQVYVVYPLVEESEKLDLRSAMESFARIRAAFPECAVDLVHGRLDASERSQAMARFSRGETQILVSTTVIEVGVDVPGATLIVVEHAERFGLAQLHQLRGRVGRGDLPGTCALVARGSSEDGEARLRAMLETTDGFVIADTDLRIRGPGEFLGTRQHGRLPDLRVADLLRDTRLLSTAREAALDTTRRDPTLHHTPDLLRAIQTRWGDRLALVGVG
jgi:ATP-dependent DNA helicase RecG